MTQKTYQKFNRAGIGFLALTLMLGSVGIINTKKVTATNCPELRLVFARGSGAEEDTNKDFVSFKNTIENKLKTTTLNYEFLDLDYPAVGVGLENLSVALGAFFGGGDKYEFGESVNTGVEKLTQLVNSADCSNTKYVLGGYSQGAMVVSKALGNLKAERIIYAATFGDPKIYLPEGEGIMPAACRGENLSDYRMYVPDCQAYKGLLGAYIPYEPADYVGKLGTWCNKKDIFCSSYFSITNHVSYVADALYEDASRVIFSKVAEHFGIENHLTSPHDTAFLIDSTGSMEDMIEQYKAEALRLARETLESGGRVALYDYRDLDDPYEVTEHCNFETCTLEIFENELAAIQADGGGDDLESLLSSSFHVMEKLKWNYGSTKSLVVLTDNGFLSPDRDGITLNDVTTLSKSIDPVNFYIITDILAEWSYIDLAKQTGGKIVTNFNELSLLTDYIMERYDSLPRVEETSPIKKPSLEISGSEWVSDTELKINFETDGEKTLVILNEQILGTTDETEIVISDLNPTTLKQILLVPISGEIRGDGAGVNFDSEPNTPEVLVPKAPNTGKV